MIKESNIRIIRALDGDAALLGKMASLLWPEHRPQDLAGEFEELLSSREMAAFIAYEEQLPVGFAQCQLRHDYVEGTDSSPVGYLEGLFVKPSHRRRGIAKMLVQACEDWAREQNCFEFASECELDNNVSRQFHLRAGFLEANQIVCFVKRL